MQKNHYLVLLLLMLFGTSTQIHSLSLKNKCIIGATLCAITYTYIKGAKTVASRALLLRNEQDWQDALIFNYKEHDRLVCRWAEDRWLDAEDISNAMKHERKAFCKAMDNASRGGFKSKYVGSQYYLVAMVKDLVDELQALSKSKKMLLFTSYCLPGLRGYAAGLLAKTEHYKKRGEALKAAIVSRKTYQSQVRRLRQEQKIDNADTTTVMIHTTY